MSAQNERPSSTENLGFSEPSLPQVSYSGSASTTPSASSSYSFSLSSPSLVPPAPIAHDLVHMLTLSVVSHAADCNELLQTIAYTLNILIEDMFLIMPLEDDSLTTQSSFLEGFNGMVNKSSVLIIGFRDKETAKNVRAAVADEKIQGLRLVAGSFSSAALHTDNAFTTTEKIIIGSSAAIGGVLVIAVILLIVVYSRSLLARRWGSSQLANGRETSLNLDHTLYMRKK